jgi:hypothetical protein
MMVLLLLPALLVAEQLESLRARPPVTLEGETHHVQGIDADGDTLWVSSVDRQARRGLLFAFDAAGRLRRSVEVQSGDRYHPGGICLSGGSLWVPVAEYRRASSAVIQKRDPVTLALQAEFAVADHIGAVAVVPEGVLGVNWDAADFYLWTPAGKLLRKFPNPSGVSIQDMKFDRGMLIAGGLLADRTGAIAWLAWPGLETKRLLRAGRTDRGVAFTNEGLAIRNGVLYLLPEDGPSRLFAFELPGVSRK